MTTYDREIARLVLAGLAMHGLLAAGETHWTVPAKARECADELLRELEKKPA